MHDKFTFDSAFMHFQKTQGPKGFIWKYLLAYAVVIFVMIVLFYGPLVATFASFFAGISPDGSDLDEATLQAGTIRLLLTLAWALPVFLLVYFVVYSMFEAAALRRYIRKEGFSLRLGKDEFRIMGVLLIWTGLVLIAYIIMGAGLFAILAPAIINGEEPDIGLLGLIPLLAVLITLPAIFFGIRLAPASAMTTRDKKIVFFGAFKVTKGRFWPMLGAFLVVYLIVYAIQMAGQMVAMVPMMGGMVGFLSSGAGETPADFASLFLNPLILIAIVFLVLVQTVSMAFAHFGFLGVTSKAVLTDPDWADPSLADTFT